MHGLTSILSDHLPFHEVIKTNKLVRSSRDPKVAQLVDIVRAIDCL